MLQAYELYQQPEADTRVGLHPSSRNERRCGEPSARVLGAEFDTQCTAGRPPARGWRVCAALNSADHHVGSNRSCGPREDRLDGPVGGRPPGRLLLDLTDGRGARACLLASGFHAARILVADARA